MNKHTQGEWRINGHRVDIGTTEDDRGYIVAGGANAEANARIACAAPTLLKELCGLVDMLAVTYQSRDQEPPGMRSARAAIAKADS
jgi:hypothetical protein